MRNSLVYIFLIPLVFTVAASSGLPLIYVGLPMLASLSVTHGFLPPHPAPTAISSKDLRLSNSGRIQTFYPRRVDRKSLDYSQIHIDRTRLKEWTL